MVEAHRIGSADALMNELYWGHEDPGATSAVVLLSVATAVALIMLAACTCLQRTAGMPDVLTDPLPVRPHTSPPPR